MIYIIAIAFICALNFATAHPDAYSSSLKDTVDCSAFPTIMSFHFHITYMLTNKDQIQRAGALREEALVAFADMLGEDPGNCFTIYINVGVLSHFHMLACSLPWNIQRSLRSIRYVIFKSIQTCIIGMERIDNGRLCMIYDHELDVTLGPFPVGEWSK